MIARLSPPFFAAVVVPAVAVDDRKVKQLVLMKLLHRARKDGIDATIGLPATKRAVDARIVNFRVTFCIPVDRQHLPLATHVQCLQDVVEDPCAGQTGKVL